MKLASTILVSFSLAAATSNASTLLDKGGVVPVVTTPVTNSVTTDASVTPVTLVEVSVLEKNCEMNVLGKNTTVYLLPWLMGNNVTTENCVYGERDSGNDAVQSGPARNENREPERPVDDEDGRTDEEEDGRNNDDKDCPKS